MKEVFTKARRANRASWFRQASEYGFSKRRWIKRGNDIRKKTFGCQTRLQAIALASGKTKFVLHQTGI